MLRFKETGGRFHRSPVGCVPEATHRCFPLSPSHSLSEKVIKTYFKKKCYPLNCRCILLLDLCGMKRPTFLTTWFFLLFEDGVQGGVLHV